MRNGLAVAAAVLLFGCVTQFQPVHESMEETFKVMKQSTDNKPVIAAFVQHANRGEVDPMLQAIDPRAREQVDDAKLREFLTKEIIPFFSDVQAVDTYEVVVGNAGFPDGRVGTIHYTYAVTKDGSKKPFFIALINEGGAIRVVNVTVGRCVKDRHPISKGRCD